MISFGEKCTEAGTCWRFAAFVEDFLYNDSLSLPNSNRNELSVPSSTSSHVLLFYNTSLDDLIGFSRECIG